MSASAAREAGEQREARFGQLTSGDPVDGEMRHAVGVESPVADRRQLQGESSSLHSNRSCAAHNNG